MKLKGINLLLGYRYWSAKSRNMKPYYKSLNNFHSCHWIRCMWCHSPVGGDFLEDQEWKVQSTFLSPKICNLWVWDDPAPCCGFYSSKSRNIFCGLCWLFRRLNKSYRIHSAYFFSCSQKGRFIVDMWLAHWLRKGSREYMFTCLVILDTGSYCSENECPPMS